MSEVFVTNMANGSLALKIFFFIFIGVALPVLYGLVRQEIRDFRAALKRGLDLGSKIMVGVKVAMFVVMLVLFFAAYYVCFTCVPSGGKWTKVVTIIETDEPLSYDELILEARDSLAEVEDQIEGEFSWWEIRVRAKEKQ